MLTLSSLGSKGMLSLNHLYFGSGLPEISHLIRTLSDLNLVKFFIA